MSGRLVRVLPKTTFDFANIANGSSPLIPLGAPVSSLDYADVYLVVYVHSLSVAASNSIVVGIYEDGFLEGNVQYVPPLNLIGSVSVLPSQTAPRLCTLGNGCRVPYVTAALTAQRAAAGALSATLSVDVMLRGADDTEPLFGQSVTVQPGKMYALFGDLPTALRRTYPRLGVLQGLFTRWGLDLDRLRFDLRNLPRGFAAQTQSADLISLSPKLVGSLDARAVYRTLAHEFTHVAQIRRLGLPIATARAIREEETLGSVGMRRIPAALRELPPGQLNPVDPRFPLEAIAGRVGELAQNMALFAEIPEASSKATGGCGCKACTRVAGMCGCSK